VLVELVRRVCPPDVSIARLGGASVRLSAGSSQGLLGECALEAAEVEPVRSLDGETLSDALARARSRDFGSALFALVALGVLEKSGASPEVRRPAPVNAARPELDRLDHEALRKRIASRRALVDEGDYFALLGVGRAATGYDVRRAYAQLREELDPTRVLTPATADLRDDVDAILSLVDEAYEILSDDSPQPTGALRERAGLEGRFNEAEFNRAIKPLWSRMLIVGTGEVEERGFPSLAVGTTELIHEPIWLATKYGPTEADKKLLGEICQREPSVDRAIARVLGSLPDRDYTEPRDLDD
jgi:hypothetical protein